jgi:hypothetical protein
VLRLLSQGTEDAGVGTSAAGSALLIDGISLETPHFQRAIDLRGDEVPIERWVRVAAVDDGLFAALDRPNHVEEQMLLDQGSEVLEQLLLDGLLLWLRRFWQRVLARRTTVGLELLVVADAASLLAHVGIRRMSPSSTASEMEYTRGKGDGEDGGRRDGSSGRLCAYLHTSARYGRQELAGHESRREDR